jgi:hypothetical protein
MNAYVEAEGMPVPDQSGDSREKNERGTPRPKEVGLQAMRRSGPPKLESFREAQPPEGAPTVETARAVWELVSVGLPTVPLPSGARPRELEDLASSVLRFAIGSTRAAVEDTAKQALTVALDVFICAGRDGKPVYINSVFQALARRWSPLFRRTPGGSVWNKKPETLTSARTEILDAGVDLAKVWTAVCDGVEGLYSVSMIGGPDHARGRRVDLEEGAPLEHLEKLILADPHYKRPRGRNRVLPADAPTPPRVIDRKTIAEKDYDAVTIGAPTEHVLQLLERARLFVDVARLRQDVTALRAAVEEHSWPKIWANWKRDNALPRDPHAEAALLERWMDAHPTLVRSADTAREAYKKVQKRFVLDNQQAKKEYSSLYGRLKQAESVLRQVENAGRFAEVKTGYKKVRNRRFQPLHFWVSEASAKKGVEQAAGTAGFELWNDFEEPFIATTSPRGRWFVAEAYDHQEREGNTVYVREWKDEKGETWWDEFTGPMRPLVGVDMSASMYQIVAIVTGDRDAEQYLHDNDLKAEIMAALKEVDHHGALQRASAQQLRRSTGVVQNTAYGQSDRSILKTLKSAPDEYSSAWQDVSLSDFRQMLQDAQKASKAVDLVLALRDSYLTTARALAQAAQAREPKGGIRLLDPFDGHPYTLNQPITENVVLPNAATPLTALVPVSDEPNWYGREVQARVRKAGKWVDAVKKDGTPRMKRVDTKGSIYTSLAPVMIHALDAAFAAHVVLKLHEYGLRDFAIINDCFLVASDAYPLLMNALEEAARPWFEGLEPFYRTFEEYLPGHPTVARWRACWEARRTAGNDWPVFRFKQETTVDLKFDDSIFDDSIEEGRPLAP